MIHNQKFLHGLYKKMYLFKANIYVADRLVKWETREIAWDCDFNQPHYKENVLHGWVRTGKARVDHLYDKDTLVPLDSWGRYHLFFKVLELQVLCVCVGGWLIQARSRKCSLQVNTYLGTGNPIYSPSLTENNFRRWNNKVNNYSKKFT